MDGWTDGKLAMELGRPHFESPWHHMPTVTLGMVFGLITHGNCTLITHGVP